MEQGGSFGAYYWACCCWRQGVHYCARVTYWLITFDYRLSPLSRRDHFDGSSSTNALRQRSQIFHTAQKYGKRLCTRQRWRRSVFEKNSRFVAMTLMPKTRPSTNIYHRMFWVRYYWHLMCGPWPHVTHIWQSLHITFTQTPEARTTGSFVQRFLATPPLTVTIAGLILLLLSFMSLINMAFTTRYVMSNWHVTSVLTVLQIGWATSDNATTNDWAMCVPQWSLDTPDGRRWIATQRCGRCNYY